MTDRRAFLLVARREVTSRVRERSFLISTSVTIVLLLVVAAAPAIFGAGGDEQVKVSVHGDAAAQVAAAAERGDASLELDLRIRRAASAAAARADVRAGRADVALAGEPPRIVVEDELTGDTGVLLQQAAARLRQAALLDRSRLSAAERDAVLQPPPLPVDRLDPEAGGGDEQEGIATIAVILLYGQLVMYGYWISAGVVEEKSSRVVEVLLSAIRPRALLGGKLLGIGLLGFAQLLLVGIIGAGTTVATGALDVPSGAWEAVGIVLAFFVLGYVLYASLYAVAGALVQRQEDLQSSTTPLTFVILVSFFAAITSVGDPDGTLAQVLTFVPPCTPMVLPVRLLAGGVAAWEVALAVLLMVAASAALVAAAARIYANAILRTGGRVRIAEAWRAR